MGPLHLQMPYAVWIRMGNGNKHTNGVSLQTHTLLCPLPKVNFINISQWPSLRLGGRAIFNLTSVHHKSICLLLGNAAQSNCGLMEHAACLWTLRLGSAVFAWFCIREFNAIGLESSQMAVVLLINRSRLCFSSLSSGKMLLCLS